MYVGYNSFAHAFQLILKNELKYSCDLGKDKFGNISRINNLLSSLPKRLDEFENKLSNTHVQLENAKKQLEKPFPHEQEFKEKSARLEQLNIELSLDKNSSIDISSSFDEKEQVQTSRSKKTRDDER